jgi:HTH-type transcriptional regulator / antitoxin HigA
MKPKLIKTEKDYHAALARIEAIFNAKPGTPAGDELELLVTLVDLYEAKAFPIDLPSPVEAIKFRMEQQGLKAKDLIPFIGSASKVSEVLAGKRSLSRTMMRNLAEGFGIPAEVLLKQPGASLPSEGALEQGRHFPIAEMLKRGWLGFEGTLREAKKQLEDLLAAFVGPLGQEALIPAFNRRHVRLGSKPDEHALTAWRIRVISLAMRESLPAYRPGTVTANFLRELARLSYFDTGPLLAKEFLNRSGIHLICEEHLPKTHLDGAALTLPDGSPLVALTLRHDRLDNFWFTLFHELAHVALHLDQDGVDAFFDDLTDEASKNKCEKQADKMASDTLIPASEWKTAGFRRNTRTVDITAFAERLRISPAIPAGRIRYEARDFAVFKPLIGAGKLRKMFGMKGT